jgi:hypothetical protein
MAVRDPGNAPASGERVGYVYIKPQAGQRASDLQGERVETPAFIREKGLDPDYEYYILHQLMNPLAQLFGIFVEEIPGYQKPTAWEDDAAAQKERIAADLLFREGLGMCKQSAKKAFISKFFSPRATPTLTKSLANVEVQGDPSLSSELSKFSSTASKKSLLKESSLFADQAAVSRASKKKAACKAAETPSATAKKSTPIKPNVEPVT